jgi:hypothetical protein
MTMLADRVDGVIGVDTHRDTLTAAAVTAVGGLLGQLSVAADAAGYQRLLDFARAHVPGRRCFAVEGAGSYGAGLRGCWSSVASGWSRSTGPSGRPAAAARPTRWMPSAPPVRRWPSSIWPRRAGVGTGRRCGCCWPPARGW